jgi:hypothetical protein
MRKFFGGLVLALFGIGGAAYGYDQHAKRKQERSAFRARLAELEIRLADAEARFGRQSAQFRMLAAELERLRRERAA